MRFIGFTTLAAAAALLLSACTTVPAVSSSVKLDPQSGNQCKVHCESLGMDLGAIVIIRNSTGCVCQPRAKPPADVGAASAVAGGVAVVMAEQEEAASQQNQSRNRTWTPVRSPTPRSSPMPGRR